MRFQHHSCDVSNFRRSNILQKKHASNLTISRHSSYKHNDTSRGDHESAISWYLNGGRTERNSVSSYESFSFPYEARDKNFLPTNEKTFLSVQFALSFDFVHKIELNEIENL